MKQSARVAAARLGARPAPRRRRGVPVAIWRVALYAMLLALAIGGYAAVALSRLPTGQAVFAGALDRVLAATASLGLVVADIEVEGRETTDAATIMAALAARRGTPILAVSPSRAREQLQSLPWVRSATIERRLPDTLYVKLVERHPLAVWQHGGKHELIDRDGSVIPVTDLSRFARLPTVVGDDAPGKAAALLDTLGSEPALAARVTAAVRVDDRRWSLRIDNTVDVLLPEDDPGAAWARLAALDRSDNLLRRNVKIVDLRLPDRLVLRTSATPPAGDAATGKKAARAPGKNT